MKAKIKEKKEIAKGTLFVTFGLLGQKIDFKPGQFFFIILPNPPYLDGRGAIRHFSIVNSPRENGIISMATRVRDSAFKKSLVELPVGYEVEIPSVSGNFVLPKEKEARELVFITGGIGITPFMSMLRFIEEEKRPYKVTLIYSNSTQESAAFLEDLKRMSKQNSNLKVILTMTQDENWRGERRRIDEQFVKDYVPDLEKPIYYLAGPPAMVSSILEVLQKAGVPRGRIKAENFGGY